MTAAADTFKTLIQGTDGTGGIVGVLNTYIVPAVFALVFIAFIWGAANYFIIQGNDESARAKGRQHALWGILALAVLIALWGIVNLLLSTLGIKPAA